MQPIDLVSPGHALRRLRDALAQARHDLAMLRTTMRGDHPSPLVTRDPRRRAESTTARPAVVVPLDARTLRLTRLVQETPDALTLHLEDISGAPLQFDAGQFLTFLLDVGGDTLRRSYSLSSSPLDGPGASITVKRINGGRASTWLHANAREGMSLLALGPQGSFVVPERASPRPRHLLLFAGGSGITPCLSIARTTLRAEPESRVTLTYGNRGHADIIFAAALDALREAHGARFVVRHTLEQPLPRQPHDTPPREPSAAVYEAGRLDRAAVARTLESIGADAAERAIFVCGPTPMMEAVCAELDAQGVASEQIHLERFTSPEHPSGNRAELPPQELTLRIGARDYALRTTRGQTILDAAQKADAPLPFSCAVGGCGACKVKVLAGSVDVETPNCLTREERARGYVLTCVGRPTSACTLSVEDGS